MPRRAAIGFAAALAAGCGGGNGPAAVSCGPAPASIDIGSGEKTFLPLADGDKVYIVCGGQGLRHVWLRFRAQGLSRRYRVTSKILEVGTDRQLAFLLPTPGGGMFTDFMLVDGHCESDSFTVIVDPPTAEANGREAMFQAQVFDDQGAEVTAQKRVVVDGSMACK